MTGGVWRIDTVAWVLAAALLPAAALLAVEQGIPGVARMVLSLAVIALWQGLFRITRGVAFSAAGAVTAVAIAALAAGELAVWQLVLAISFGTVLGELIFGGWGRNVLSGAALTLAFLYISFPGVIHPAPGIGVAAAAAAAAILLLACGVLSAAVLTAAIAAAAGVAALTGSLAVLPGALGALGFAAVFVLGDPVAAAASRPGRWAYGALAGALAALFLASGSGVPQAAVFAALLAQIFAPLIDYAAISLTMRDRRSPADG